MTEYGKYQENEPRSIDVGTLLPQGQAFRMVDTLLYCDDGRAISETVIRSDNPFCDHDGTFMESGLLENIAQTCALRIGFISRLDNRTVPKAGVIAVVRKMDIHRLVNLGDTLLTEIIVENEVFGMISCRGRVEHHGSLVCEAELRLMV